MNIFINFILITILSLPSISFAKTSYTIEEEIDYEKFIINGEKFEAKTYCLMWEEGDKVVFIEGSPLGACASAKLYNIKRDDTCEVWCE